MKDFQKQISDLRDELHKDIIKRTISQGADEFELELKLPFIAYVMDNDEKVPVCITGVDGTTGEILSRSITDGGDFDVHYGDLSMEELAFLHKQIETESFTINVI